jgi:hypothetical protein
MVLPPLVVTVPPLAVMVPVTKAMMTTPEPPEAPVYAVGAT